MPGPAQPERGAASAPSFADVDVSSTPTKLAGRYVLCAVIGQGGMARVHVGRLLGSEAFARTVAIKRLLPRFAEEPDFRMMLTDEARLAARVRHPNVVQMLDVMSTGAELFLVMEYIDGVSLGRLIRKAQQGGGRVPEPILAAILCHVLHGLHAAHEATDEKGAPLTIVHRDVSPDNVLVGADGMARVLDFRVAKASSRLHKTRDGEIKGKLSYMAPEQLSGRATRQSDIFSASIILWEGLVGQRLFRADDDGETIGRVLAAVVEPPVSLAPNVTPRLSDIVLRGLARDPKKRWATAREMALALEQGVPLATPSQVGAWVESMDGAWLVERRALVQRVEAPAADIGTAADVPGVTRRLAAPGAVNPAAYADTETHAPVLANAAAAPEQRRRTGRYVLGLGALAASATLLAWVARPSTRASPVTATAATSPASFADASSPELADVPAPPDPPSIAPVTAAPSAPSKPARVRRRAGAPSVAPGRPADKPAANACDPPYRLGPLGEKVWLKECL